MRYLWETRVRIRNDRSLAAIGSKPSTPIDDAVRATLVGGFLAATALIINHIATDLHGIAHAQMLVWRGSVAALIPMPWSRLRIGPCSGLIRVGRQVRGGTTPSTSPVAGPLRFLQVH
jgi:hypothetical protein